MATPHNTAEKGQIAKVCLMPGDPLRAKLIADTYLENAVCYNTARGMFCYTGEYKGEQISVMGHGMGIPSVGIYTYELFKFYDVEKIIRIGSIGALREDLNLGDVIIAQGACTDSNFAKQYKLPGTYAPIADYELLSKLVETAKEKGTKATVGNVLTSDVFYTPYNDDNEKWRTMGVIGIEMECAGLFMNAAFLNKQAAAILTVSDIIGNSTQKMTTEERQTKLMAMIEIALDTAVRK